ncbi:DUF4184 family protein [Pontibacter sp. SGAir0037]
MPFTFSHPAIVLPLALLPRRCKSLSYASHARTLCARAKL